VRLFVALNLPGDVREVVWRETAPVRSGPWPVAWVRPDGMHVTLKFLGEVAPEREAELGTGLARAAAGNRAVTVSLGGLGAFPGFAAPRVIWVGVAPEPALELLQHQAEREFAALGFPLEGRPFRPHLTLGRVRRGAAPSACAGLEAALGGLACDTAGVVDTIDLMESVGEAKGVRYRIRQSERLL